MTALLGASYLSAFLDAAPIPAPVVVVAVDLGAETATVAYDGAEYTVAIDCDEGCWYFAHHLDADDRYPAALAWELEESGPIAALRGMCERERAS